MVISKIGKIMALVTANIAFISAASFAELASEFNRNGEAYLSIANKAKEEIDENTEYTVYRLNDPEKKLNGAYPSRLFTVKGLQVFGVDIDRNVFTVASPDVSDIGSNYMLKRQVVDYTAHAPKDSREQVNSYCSVTKQATYPTSYVPTFDGTYESTNVTADNSDYGCHSYCHHDNRTAYGGSGQHTTIYRTSPYGTDGQDLREIRGSYPSGRFKARQGKKTSAPSDPLTYLPAMSVQQLVLPYYPGKAWYEVPNGMWFSSWRRIKGCGWYYQCYIDKATGKQYDWRMVSWKANNSTKTNYTGTKNSPFAQTYQMSISRGVIAGCLDGCGGSSAKPGTTQSESMQFHSAFMPYGNKGECAVYSYSRTKGKTNYNLDSNVKRDYTTFGAGNKSDTNWIGVSKGPTVGGKERDYVYFLGTSNLQSWIPEIKNQNIQAVSVSNQWNEEGGIIFAYDKKSNNIIKLLLNSDGSRKSYETSNVSTLLNKIGVNSSLDDLAADGFGNLYLAFTYPSTDPNYDVPTKLKWNYNNAESYEYTPPSESGIYGVFRFKFKVDYRKSVWKVSNKGEEMEEVGSYKSATRWFYRDVQIPAASVSLIPPSSTLPADINDTVIKNAVSQSAFLAMNSITAVKNDSKLAVINAPTPPSVLSLGGKGSYLDIIGPYADTIPTPDILNKSTNQNSKARTTGNLALSKVYMYMVENYPLSDTQNPNNTPDYDGDTRIGGFVSTILPGSAKDSLQIEYYWKIYGIRDYDGNPYKDENGKLSASLMNEANDNFVVFYTPVPGKFILTCKAKYKWYDYDTVKFGQTIGDWKAKLSENGGEKTSWAYASGVGSTAGAPVIENCQNRIKSLITAAYSDYKDTDKDDIITTLTNQIVNDNISNIDSDPAIGGNYVAVESITAAGDPPVFSTDGSTDIARIQKHCVDPSDSSNKGLDGETLGGYKWAPTSGINPSDGYHGIDSQRTYYWRIDTASQAMFLETDKNSLSSNANYYKFIADRLEDPKNKTYYVNGNKGLKFKRNGSDIRWKDATPSQEAFLTYQTIDKSGNKKDVTLSLSDPTKGLDQSIPFKQNSSTIKYKYFKIDADTLPATDPFEAKLQIKLTRMFEYDMYIFDDNGNQLMSTPIRLPKQLTIIGEAKVIVVNTKTPSIIYSQTKPNQLFAITGQALQSSNGSTDVSIGIRIDNALEKTSPTPHAKWNSGNYSFNKSNKTSNDPNVNLKPSFNSYNRYVKIRYETSGLTSIPNNPLDMKIATSTAEFMPVYGNTGALSNGNVNEFKDKNTINLERIDLYNLTSLENSNLYAEMKFKLPLSNLNGKGSYYTPQLNYANNTPGYQPLKFFLSARDSSGNETGELELNLVMHIKDSIAPFPYGTVKEYKNNVEVCFPSINNTEVNIKNSDYFKCWIASYSRQLRFCNTLNNSDLIPNAKGIIGKYGIYELKALPLVGVGDKIENLVPPAHFASVDNWQKTTPGQIQIEQDTEVRLLAGATDNSGASYVSMKFNCYDLDGEEKTVIVNSVASGSYNASYIASGTPTIGKSIIFRTGKDKDPVTGEEKDKPYPYAIPITITAIDDARDWDQYDDRTSIHSYSSFKWGKLKKGSDNPLRRELKTVIPVYGTKLDIRTIEKYTNTTR